MSILVFQSPAGGQVNLNGPSTASTFDIAVPATTGTMVTTGDTGTVSSTMLASSIYTAPGTIGSGTANSGAFTTLSASSTVSGAGFTSYFANPPAIGGSTPAAGSFTTLAASSTFTGSTITSAAATALTLKSAGTTAITINTNQAVGFSSTPSYGTAGQILYSTGSSAAPVWVTPGASMVRLNTANGLGSTNTTVRRFTNVVTNQGSDITYADSATLGASFTINTAGVYSINYSDAGASGTAIGITLNCTQNSATCENLTDPSQLLIGGVTPAAGQAGYPSWTGQLAAGSVIRASLGTNGTTYPKTCTFTITRIG